MVSIDKGNGEENDPALPGPRPKLRCKGFFTSQAMYHTRASVPGCDGSVASRAESGEPDLHKLPLKMPSPQYHEGSVQSLQAGATVLLSGPRPPLRSLPPSDVFFWLPAWDTNVSGRLNESSLCMDRLCCPFGQSADLNLSPSDKVHRHHT